jgi:hypothetical protein
MCAIAQARLKGRKGELELYMREGAGWCLRLLGSRQVLMKGGTWQTMDCNSCRSEITNEGHTFN